MAIEVQNANGWGSDIQAEAPVSSVGAVVWPPREATEQRRKGVLGRVLETPGDLTAVLSQFSALPFGENKAGEPVTRISGRIFVPETVLFSLEGEERERLGQLAEAMVPLRGAGIPALEDTVMVYLGRNDAGRRTPPAVLEAEAALAAETFVRTPSAASREYADYDFRVLTPADRNDASLQREYADLYAAFGWNEADVVSMLTNPGNTLMAAFHNAPGMERGALASAVIAERACLPVVRGGETYPLELAEITEAITTPEHRGNGLYTELAIRLMGELASTDVNLIYGESNALRVHDRAGNIRQPVLSSVAKLGRDFSLSAMARFGFAPRLLEQHVRISMGEGDTRPAEEKNDLLVTFMPKASLVARYGKP